MKARSNSFESILIASFYDHPMMTHKERGELLSVPEHVVRFTIKELESRGIDDLKRIQFKIVSEAAREMPGEPVSKVAEKIKASPIIVGNLLKEIESQDERNARRNAAKNHKTELSPEERAAKHKELVENIRQALIDFPFATYREIGLRFKCGFGTVEGVANKLEAENQFDRAFEREILLAEFVAKNPDALKKDAAMHFGTSVNRIARVKGASALRNFPKQEKVVPELNYLRVPNGEGNNGDGEDWPCNSEIDRDMESRICLRPAWYMEEVRKNGGIGICLPEDEFKLYLELRERRKRLGTSKIPLPIA